MSFGGTAMQAATVESATTVAKPADPLHAWVGLKDAAGLEAWVQWHIGEEKRLIAELEGLKGKRTVENTLAKYDEAVTHLQVAGNQAYIMFSVNPNKAIRDKGQALVQVISAEQTALALNQAVYTALKATDMSTADAATKHFVDRLLLEYRLGGVDKDQATRDKVKKLQDEMTEVSLAFSRNVQDDVRKVTVKSAAELDGLPADYVARHTPGADGTITLTTDSPDYTPVMNYAKSAGLRRRMYLAYNDRAYPVNKAVLEHLLRVRQEMATTLGFATWADLATADMMMGSAGKMKTFLNEVDEASRSRAEKEFVRIKDYVAATDPKAAADLTQADAGYSGPSSTGGRITTFDSQSCAAVLRLRGGGGGHSEDGGAAVPCGVPGGGRCAGLGPIGAHAYDVYEGGQEGGSNLPGHASA